jgi:glutamate-1-semialdehyde 2,1-aminomutase
MGSTRFPNKVMQLINGKPLIELLLVRLSRSQLIEQIILATSIEPRNLPLVEHVQMLGYPVFQGSENDVLDRYYCAAKPYAPEIVVRITGDCPLIDVVLVDQAIERILTEDLDFVGNAHPPTYPDGLDIHVFTLAALEKAHREATKPHDREHVVPYLINSEKFKVANIANSEDRSDERWTVDEPEDFRVVKAVFDHFAPRVDFSWLEVLELRKSRPELFAANRKLIRNEGSELNTGQKLWKRAKRVIPGGGMLLSKRPEMFLPMQWPSYFKAAKGCHVWDLDGRQFVDMSLMGVGTNTLGYGHDEVDEAVRQTVASGNMSTLNCPEEVYLAEALVALHPWAEMARLARTGGEANAIAIRIARAASGRDKVAFCGYHGWHDWYLAANLGGEKKLEEHLLPGLAPNGVPRDLVDSVLPFSYNRFDQLEALVAQHDIGVIKMEVMRNIEPDDDFLQKVRRLASKEGIVLIFDECTSGFRQTLGGLHKQYGVNPDMAVFGKAIGNGYALTAVIGRREVMEHAQSTFISSTFWTERIGPTAAIKTLEIMERIRSYDQITATGREIGKGWQQIAAKYRIPLRLSGLPALISFHIDSPNMRAYKTLIAQEMLERGFLAGASVYACTEHTPELVKQYLDLLDPIFATISECEAGRPVIELLKGPICESGFGRLN